MEAAGFGLIEAEDEAMDSSLMSTPEQSEDDFHAVLQKHTREISNLIQRHLENNNKGASDDCGREGLDACAAALLARPARQVRRFLMETADVLLKEEGRTASLAYVGGLLSKPSRHLLRVPNVRFARILACYSADFRIDGISKTITYLRTENQTQWKICYPV
eukprot:TRINITY_DN31309_c0_g1_i1.p1 TRINITY_DN31309_c0_g1~~TRINITY_DN31309_c0_g1_i1.p1  ORF type:complete len:162 (+),score=15.67 TRINITY_DN31309_c0_g1_i1:109-594(+)